MRLERRAHREHPAHAGSTGGRFGRVTSSGYGYAVGASIAYAYMPVVFAEPGATVAIDIFGDWIDGEVRTDPLYDPKGERIWP